MSEIIIDFIKKHIIDIEIPYPGLHTHMRSAIADFWNTPFWNNIPDKPSEFPPSSHNHPRSNITDFWSAPFWNNIPDKPPSFPPSSHANAHHAGGSDALSFSSIAGFSDYLDQAVKQASSPTFANLKLTGLSDNYIPYKTSQGLANSPLYIYGTNVGIGTTAPNHKLAVNAGSINIIPSGGIDAYHYNGERVLTADTVAKIIYLGGVDPGYTSLRFRTQGTDKVAIDSTGKVGIGTTSPSNILTIVQNSETDPIADSWLTYPCGTEEKTILGGVSSSIISNFLAIPTYTYQRKALASDEEIKKRAISIRLKNTSALLAMIEDEREKEEKIREIENSPLTQEEIETARQEIISEKSALPKFQARRIGVMIDDLPREVVLIDEKGNKAIDLLAMVGYLWAVVKEIAKKLPKEK